MGSVGQLPPPRQELDSLFVYGTLAPGRPNEHVLVSIGGTFQPTTLRGHLKAEGWGAGLGFPGLVPDSTGPEVPGFVFASANLMAHWEELDAFEGAEYRRVRAVAQLANGEHTQVWVYALAERR